MSNHKKYASCIGLLYGSPFDLGVNCVSMALSTSIIAGGIIVMVDDMVERFFVAQPVLFLVAQSFTVTTMWRDRTMFHEFDIAKPTLMNFYQSIFFFVCCFGFVLHSLFAVVEWKGFYATCMVWVLASALNLSKFMRDRNYADIFAEVHDEDLKYYFTQVASICKGSLEYRLLVWFTSLLSFVILIVVVWAWDSSDLPMQSKTFITIALIWWGISSVHLAHLLHLKSDPVIAIQLKENIPFQLMVLISSVLAYGMLVWMLVGLDLTALQRFHILVGWGFSAFGLCMLGKHLADRQRALYLEANVEFASDEELEPTISGSPRLSNSSSKGRREGEVPSRKQVGRKMQEIEDFYAPAQHRGTAAQLIGQRSLVNAEGSVRSQLGHVTAQMEQTKPPELFQGLPTE